MAQRPQDTTPPSVRSTDDEANTLVAELQRQLAEAALLTKQAERERDEARREVQKTTLFEYLDANHDHVFASFAVQQDPTRTTEGNTTPANKRVPKNLRPWPVADFLQLQNEALTLVHTHLPSDPDDNNNRRFENLSVLKGVGERLRKVPIANEYHVESYQKLAVEMPILSILDELRKVHDPGVPLGTEVTFDRHSVLLGDTGDSYKRPRKDKVRADQHLTVFEGASTRKIALLVEYKVPHKLTQGYIRVGLHPMDIYQDVVNRATKPSGRDEDEVYKYNAEQLVAAAVVQTYDYMLSSGLQYGYFTTCEAIVFLKIDWKNPETVYYHLAEPLTEVAVCDSKANSKMAISRKATTNRDDEDSDEDRDRRDCTAIAQILAFTILALKADPISQKQRHSKAVRDLDVWELNEALILAQVAETPGKPSVDSPAFKGPNYRGPRRKPNPVRGAMASCKPPVIKLELDEDDDYHSADFTPTRPSRGHQRPRQGAPADKQSSSSSQGKYTGSGRQYCTQKCLLGLVRRGQLDRNCPNFLCHRSDPSNYHTLDHENWLRLVHGQLNADLDHDIQPLGIQGARGAMFKVTLSTHGYTFLAKGTVDAFVENLKHEASIYHRLQRLQGICIPVFLGAVELDYAYHYTFGERINYLVFLSWGGQALNDGLPARMSQHTISQELRRSIRSVHAMGVLQADVRAANALWNNEAGRVFVIDFERATIITDRHLPLAVQEAPKNQKKRRFAELEFEDKWEENLEEETEMQEQDRAFADRRAISAYRNQMHQEVWHADYVFGFPLPLPQRLVK